MAGAAAAFQHGAETGPACLQPLQSQQAVTKMMLVGEAAQRFLGRTGAGIQPVQPGRCRRIDLAGMFDRHLAAIQPDRKLARDPPQLLVVQRAQGLDQLRLQQLCADVTGHFDHLDAARLTQQRGFGRVTEMVHDAVAQVDALADVQRQRAALSMEQIDPGRGRQGVQFCTQMLGVGLVRCAPAALCPLSAPHHRRPPVSVVTRCLARCQARSAAVQSMWCGE